MAPLKLGPHLGTLILTAGTAGADRRYNERWLSRAAPAIADVRVVGASGGGLFELQEAIDAAADGDTILILGGSHLWTTMATSP